MSTITSIHDEIDNWVAAAVHEELSAGDNAQFESHLAECAGCRAVFEETRNMNRILNVSLAGEAADPAFEQRMVTRFRNAAPRRAGLLQWLAGLPRYRGVQIAGVAALLLALVQLGGVLTDEVSHRPLDAKYQESKKRALVMQSGQKNLPATSAMPAPPPAAGEGSASRVIVTGSSIPTAEEVGPSADLSFKDSRADTSTMSNRSAGFAGAVASDAAANNKLSAATQAPAAGVVAETAPAEERAMNEEMAAAASPNPATPDEPRKLIRNAQVELEVLKYEESVSRISNFAKEDRGFIATSSSEKLANGKLQGTVVVKVAPENLERVLQKIRSLGELKNQTLGTDDVTKAYFDTESRQRNAKRMEERLLDLLGKTGRVGDLLQVEKELARVRQEIEQMQGQLKYWDALVSYATVTISLAEKNLEEPAEFLLKRTANLSLFASDVEKTFGEIKATANEKIQIVTSGLDRDYSGRVTGRISLSIAAEAADEVIARVRGFGRVQSFNESTERIPQGGGEDSAATAQTKVEQDKVQLNITVTRDEQEPPIQRTSLRVLTKEVTGKVTQLRQVTADAGGEVRSSTFNREVDGSEFANVVVRVPLSNHGALMTALEKLGKVRDVRVQREDRPELANPETAPAEITAQIYTQPDIVADESGLFATIRRTLGQGASALMWSLRMIGVALAFLAPWAAALAGGIWFMRWLRRRRADRA